MLLKEYRICMPLTVEEYRIAQLYMIQKKSREESEGDDSGVEIARNEPYSDGPGGKGQYTYKIYHIQKHIPSWFKSVLPKTSLVVYEDGWNAYPYTKTKYRTPLVEKFSLEIDTVYYNDGGEQENVFNLSAEELASRELDMMDVAVDPVPPADYCAEEDPLLYKSVKTGRGPLTLDWKQRHKAEGKPMMCAYKLCRVTFHYWGMQGRIEHFVQDNVIRRRMIRAHRQAWAWQDEYQDLTMDDIRRLERETAQELARKYASQHHEGGNDEDCSPVPTALSSRQSSMSEDDQFYDAEDHNSLLNWGRVPDASHPSPAGAPPHVSPLTDSQNNSGQSALLLVFHGDSLLEYNNQDGDYLALKGMLSSLTATYYPGSKLKLVSIPFRLMRPESRETLSNLAVTGQLSPLVPPLLAPVSADALCDLILLANEAYSDNAGVSSVSILADGSCALPVYEALTRGAQLTPRRGSSASMTTVVDAANTARQNTSMSNISKDRRSPSLTPRTLLGPRPSAVADSVVRLALRPNNLESPMESHLDFSVENVFFVGSPLSAILSQRRDPLLTPRCRRVYNVFYTLDNYAFRIEPLLDPSFTTSAVQVPRASLMLADPGFYPMECDVPEQWWGSDRIDFGLRTPVGLPPLLAPLLVHTSYWESRDMAALILTQILGERAIRCDSVSSTTPEKWLHRRTNIKLALRQSAPNHRANDVIMCAGCPSAISAKFAYGSLDVRLSREKIDCHGQMGIGEEWGYLGTALTDKAGRMFHQLPADLPSGVHPLKLVVRGDHSICSLHLALLPPNSEFVIFSIDGSFSASVSLSGTDPRLRPGSVDIARHWASLGYFLLYVTARPDLQQHHVVDWLASHNFPFGFVQFPSGLTAEPLRHKAQLLRSIVTMSRCKIIAAYGSAKDVSVYSEVGIAPHLIHVVGSVRRRQSIPGINLLSDGYGAHITALMANAPRASVSRGISRPATLRPASALTRIKGGGGGEGGNATHTTVVACSSQAQLRLDGLSDSQSGSR